MPANDPVSFKPLAPAGFVRVRGARQHNLKDVDVDIPRDQLVVFTGVSGSGKSSLAFGTLYAEAERRYLESVSPYARRLFHQMGVPEVDEIDGLPPAVALQQQRGGTSTRSSVGTVTTLSNLLRMLYSRAGDYPPKQTLLYAESFSPNTPEGACPQCQGQGRSFTVTETSLVPDPTRSIRQRAVAAWPSAWQGQNLRDILTTLGHDVDVPWNKLPKKTRDWILFTDEQPTVPVYAGYDLEQVQRALKRKETPSYQGTFTSARRYVLQTYSTSTSERMRRRAEGFLLSAPCPECQGKRLNKAALSVRFAGLDIAELSALPLSELATLVQRQLQTPALANGLPAQTVTVRQRIGEDLRARLAVLLDLGLGYLSVDRSTPTLSPGELQRLRLATQVRSNLFGVVYVLDEPSAGLHPADTEALLRALGGLKAAGNSLFVVEHEIDVIRRADWIVDVGPHAGDAGGEILYSGPLPGLAAVAASSTRRYVFEAAPPAARARREVKDWLRVSDIERNNLKDLSVEFPLGVLSCVTGISGSGKSTLVSQVLVSLLRAELGDATQLDEDAAAEADFGSPAAQGLGTRGMGTLSDGVAGIKRLVVVDQKPIGRTPRSNLATYTGLFDAVRKLFAGTQAARARGYDAGRFSFNVAGGRCETCSGEGFVMVELLFLPSVYAPCAACNGARYNAQTLEIQLRGQNIAQVLSMTVQAASEFFQAEPAILRTLNVLNEVGLGYLRLGQPATELSGGEAQRIKLATELQRSQRVGTLYVLDEPTTGLHPADVERLLRQLQSLVNTGATVIVVEHDLAVIAESDWLIDMGPGAGGDGGRIVFAGTPAALLACKTSRTAPYLARYLA